MSTPDDLNQIGKATPQPADVPEAVPAPPATAAGDRAWAWLLVAVMALLLVAAVLALMAWGRDGSGVGPTALGAMVAAGG
jgi:hypothetical protein